MPISSYHRLPSTSTCKPWNTTKSPRHSGRQRSRTFHAGDTDVSCGIKPDALTANEGESSGTVKARPKSATGVNERRAGRRESVGKRTRSTRSALLGRPPLKRRETFPTLRKERDGNGSARITARNNRSDFSIRSKVSRWKQGNSQQSKKSAWSAKRQERKSDYAMKPKGRSNKVHSSSPLLLHSSPTDGVAICGNLQNSNIGQRVVCVLNKRICLGVLKYCGRTHFAEGHWCGIVLDKPCGKNDGSVRGVRYFQCKSKYGIFVHSHKVGTLDDYWNWVSSQVYNSESHTAPSTRVLTENQNWNNIDMSCIEKHCRSSIFSKNNNEHKTFHKIEKRTRSHSLDRCCVVKVKLSKQSGSKCMSSAQLVRSASLPKIGRSYSLVSGKSSCDKDGQHHQGNRHNGENSTSKKMFPGDKDFSGTLSPNTPDEELSPGATEKILAPSSDSMDFISTKFEHVATSHKKLGHTMSLDTHLRMKNGLQTDNSGANGWHPGFTDENSLANSKNADAFLEGQYASCPSLTPSVQGSKISDGLGTCRDMEQSNREAHAGKSGLEVKNKGNDLESENSKNVLKFQGNSASQSRLLQPSPPLGDVQGEKSHERLSLPCLLPRSSSNDAESKKVATLQQQCCPSEGDIDLPLEGDETASSGHISDSETSLSSSGNCCLNNFSKVPKESLTKPPSVKHPSKLQRPGDFKDHISSKPMNIGRIPPGKKNISSSGEVVNRPAETRPSKLELDKRLQKRNTVSDIRSTVVDQAAERGIPEHVAVTGNKSQEMKGGKLSKLPLLKHGSFPHMQPALKETAPVPRRASGLQVPSVKTTKPKTSMSSGNARQGAHEKMAGAASTVKPASRNAQTPRDSAVAATQHGTRTATRRASASSSKTAKPPVSGTKRTSTTSVPEERKISSSSRPGTKQSSKPLSTAQSTSRPNSKLLKFPSRKTPDKSSTPEPCTEYADKKVRPVEQSTVPRRVIHAPDILSQTPEVSKHSVGVQVNDEKGQKVMEELKSKSQQLEELLSNEKKQCQTLEASLKDLSSDCLAAAIVVNFFGGELNGCGRNILLLQTKANTLLEELKDTQKRLADEQANGVKLQEEIMYTISEHKIAIEILKANHDRMLGELKQNLTARFTEEMGQVVRSNTSQLEEEKAEHARGIESLMKKHEESTAALVEEHKDEITELENKQSQAVEEIMEEHQVEVETIKADYEEQETKLKNKIEELSGECQSLGQMLKKTQEDAQRDIESRIQDAIKSYESLPAELESMKAVLEIKNEEIKNLRQEKMEIKMELEHLRKIQDRIQKLEQENESLNFVVESKSAFQRQLSVERDTLRNSLEREAKKANRLSLENEELQWRLFNSPSPPLSADSGQGSVARHHRLSLSFPDVTTLDE